MKKKINPFKKKAETLSASDNHHQAVAVLSYVKSIKVDQSYVRIRVSNGFILVATDKYNRKKQYYESLFGKHNIII